MTWARKETMRQRDAVSELEVRVHRSAFGYMARDYAIAYYSTLV